MKTFKPVIVTFFMVVLFFILILENVSATTYYVATSGSDSNSGTESKPFKTIPKAVSNLRPGDTVMVRKGTYPAFELNSLNGTSDKWITFQAYPGEPVIFDRYLPSSANYAIIRLNAVCSYLVFDGFELTNSNPVVSQMKALDITDSEDYATYKSLYAKLENKADGWDYKGGFRINPPDAPSGHSHITIKNCTIHDITGIAFSFPWSGTNPDNIQLINNTVYDLVQSGYGVYGSGANILFQGNTFRNCHYGLHITTLTDSIIENNIFSDNKAPYYWFPGDKVKTSDGCGIAIWKGGSNITIRNNVIYGSNAGVGQFAAGIYIETTKSSIYNNTVYNNGIGIFVDPSKNATIKNNICYNNKKDTDIGSGNTMTNNLIGVNPNFVNAGAGNFQLKYDSSAIDKGATIPAITTDIEGTPRPQGLGYDIGAYEHGDGKQDTTPPAPPQGITILQ